MSSTRIRVPTMHGFSPWIAYNLSHGFAGMGRVSDGVNADTGTELEMIHANVPEHDADAVKKGWNDYYWSQWKAYIKK